MDRPPAEELSSGHGERQPRRRWPLGIVLIALIAAVVATMQYRRNSASVPDPAATASPTPHAVAAASHPAMAGVMGAGTALGGVRGDPVDVLAQSGDVYVAETRPALILRVYPRSGRVVAQAAAPSHVEGLAVDRAHRLIWAWGEGSGGAVIQSYNVGSLHPIRRQHTILYVFDAAAYQGRLWLTTDRGMFWIGIGSAAPHYLPSAGADVFAIAADPARHRLLVAARTLRAIDPVTGTIVRTVPLTVGKPSLAFVGDRVWVGGFGDSDVAKLVAYDPATLRPQRRQSGLDAQLGPGAIVWPGEHVVWVRDGGSEELSCVNGRTGAIEGQWPRVQGPVASDQGAIYAIDVGTVRRISLPPRCAG